jgi:crotonobetainyl-CoA:carnitine CoA-transferase CaiB-like acyl-CoA transferase
MKDVLAGIRVVEVASWTFVPISGAVLSEWGADVIKIEHPGSGDPQRGLVSSGLVPGGDGVNFMFEIPNRGKRSVGLDISTDDGRELLYRLVETADVFVTNYLPDVRKRLGIDVDEIRARNPNVIYVRGTGQGTRGPDAEKGGFDGASYWARAGLAMTLKDRAAEWPADQRPAFGDVMGGLTIAGGITAALLRRERTGVPSTVDVSLLSLGLWNLAPDVTSAKLYEGVEIPTFDRDSLPNPLVGTYPTKDGRFIILVLLQADRYWPDL